MHAPLDATVGIDEAEKIYAAARHPKSFVSLDDADHLLTRKKDAEYVATTIAAWASRYLTLADERPSASLNRGHVRVEEKDHKTNSFLKWFVDEQVEEEANAEDNVKNLELVKDSPNGLFMIDREMASRVYVPIAAEPA